jgi:hypothetical protein
VGGSLFSWDLRAHLENVKHVDAGTLPLSRDLLAVGLHIHKMYASLVGIPWERRAGWSKALPSSRFDLVGVCCTGTWFWDAQADFAQDTHRPSTS